MGRKIRFLGLNLLIILMVGIIPQSVMASNAGFQKINRICNDINASDEMKKNAGCEDDGVTLEKKTSGIINLVFGLVGIVAAIVLVIGAVNYTISQGDANKIAKAKHTIMYGLIGMLIVLASFVIVNFVMSKI